MIAAAYGVTLIALMDHEVNLTEGGQAGRIAVPINRNHRRPHAAAIWPDPVSPQICKADRFKMAASSMMVVAPTRSAGRGCTLARMALPIARSAGPPTSTTGRPSCPSLPSKPTRRSTPQPF